MNETQKFNLHRHLIIQALKALVEYHIRMLKDERSVNKDYYFEHFKDYFEYFEEIYKYILKAEQSKLSPEESIALCSAVRVIKSSQYFGFEHKDILFRKKAVSLCVDLVFIRNLHTKGRDTYFELLDPVNSTELDLSYFLTRGRIFDEYIYKYGWDRLYLIDSLVREKGNLIYI